MGGWLPVSMSCRKRLQYPMSSFDLANVVSYFCKKCRNCSMTTSDRVVFVTVLSYSSCKCCEISGTSIWRTDSCGWMISCWSLSPGGCPVHVPRGWTMTWLAEWLVCWFVGFPNRLALRTTGYWTGWLAPSTADCWTVHDWADWRTPPTTDRWTDHDWTDWLTPPTADCWTDDDCSPTDCWTVGCCATDRWTTVGRWYAAIDSQTTSDYRTTAGHRLTGNDQTTVALRTSADCRTAAV